MTDSRQAIALRAWFALSLALASANGYAAEDATRTTNVTWTIPLDLSRGRVMVPARVNSSQPLSFLLDTGYGVTTIHPDLIEPLGLKRAGRITIVGISGEEEAGMYEGAVFDIAGATYAPRRVASVPSEARARSRRRDGILGAGFFRRYVVEIDSAGRSLRLYEPKTFVYSGGGQIIPLDFPKDTPVIEAGVMTPKRGLARGRFEIDTGCDGDLCLGREFVTANQLTGSDDESRPGLKQGVGGDARIREGSVAQLHLGTLVVEQPSASFFLDGSPSDDGLAGHIGMPALRRFKVIFDYSRRRLILEPASAAKSGQ